MFDLNLLLVFEAMCLHQNVTTAGAHMGLTQSAMSSALGRMRREFDDPLFVKTRDGMLPTSRALGLVKPLRQALSLIRSTTETGEGFDPRTSTRTFRFHLTDIGEMVFLPALVKRLDSMGSTVKVETAQLTLEQVARQLESGEIDLAGGYWPTFPQRIESVRLFREHYVCMTGRGYPLRGEGHLTLKRFLSGSHVLIESMGSGHAIIERTLERQGVKRDVSLRVPHFMVIPMIVANTNRIVTIPSRVASIFSGLTDVQVHRLPVRIPGFDVTLLWHARFANDPGIRFMRDTMIDLFQDRLRTRGAAAAPKRTRSGRSTI